MPSGRIKLHVSDVLLAVPASIGVEAGMVVLTEEEAPGRSLRIIIGQPEAKAIRVAWEGLVSGRPLTWDLFVSALALLGARIERAVITAVEEERHYYAIIELEHQGQRPTLSCRPSDAIALAVRADNAEIVAEASVMDAAGVLADGSKPAPGAEPAPGGAQLEPSGDQREAALARREAELAARERALAHKEAQLDQPDVGVDRGGRPDPSAGVPPSDGLPASGPVSG